MDESLKWFATLGVGGVLAAFMFIFYRKDVQAYTEQWRGQTDALMAVMRENTAAISAMTITVQALHRRDDRIEDALSQLGYTSHFRVRDRGDAAGKAQP